MTINVFGGGNSSAPVFPVQRSVRLRSSASAYFARTPASAGNRKIWTWSAWVKRGALGSSLESALFTAGNQPSNTYDTFQFLADFIRFTVISASVQKILVTTPSLFRDPSAWYHIVISIDTTQATSTNGVRIWVNNVLQPLTVTAYTQNQDCTINSTSLQRIGILDGYASSYFDGYLTEVNFIDGQALTPTSFGSYNSSTGVWQPVKYTGTYGTNGFYLNFQDNSGATATTIGKDSSGNGNNWTPNNISVTAGVTYDSMVDVPTLTGATNANFAVGNPLNADGSTWSSGNLNFSLPNSTNNAQGTVSVTSGKWYWEMVYSAQANSTGVQEIGLRTRFTSGVLYGADGTKYVNGTNSAYGAAYTTGDIIGVALDMDASTVTFYKNNTSQGSISLTGSGCVNATFTTSAGGGTTSTGSVNFGQRPFTYTPPSGFKSLNTFNLPDSTIPKGNKHFTALVSTGDGNLTRTFTGVGFAPDFVWQKDRTSAIDHWLIDSVRGAAKNLQSNTTVAEVTSGGTNGALNQVESDGYSILQGSSTSNNVNKLNDSYVAWCWKAGGTAVTNTSGSISSQVSANPTAGFSIVTYTGTGVAATVGHGLNVAPRMIIVKTRTGTAREWVVGHSSLSGGWNDFILLSNTAAKQTGITAWNNTAPTSSVFSLGTGAGVNESTILHVAYCFSEIAGFSKFGSYTGNGSADGPFVYLGFRPRWVMVKSTGVNGWVILDTSRSTFNLALAQLIPNLANAEDTTNDCFRCDILSNGFKLRTTGTPSNANGVSYIYAAFAESPFKNALAR